MLGEEIGYRRVGVDLDVISPVDQPPDEIGMNVVCVLVGHQNSLHVTQGREVDMAAPEGEETGVE